MAAPSSDLAPAFLREAWNRAIGDPTSDNAPLQRFNSPLDELALTETVLTGISTEPPLYGKGHYGVAHYAGSYITRDVAGLGGSSPGTSPPGS